MSINNINHLRYLQNRQNERQNNANTQNQAQNETQSQNVTNPVNSSYYRQYLVGSSNVSFTGINTVNANNSEELLHQIFELDKAAFEELDPYDSYDEFYSRIVDGNFKVFGVKDSDTGKLLGYYQLEPIKNGDLYIDSMALAPEFRHTRKGVEAIKHSWQKIKDYARENGAQTMSLHVDGTNEALVNLYKRFGFVIKETLENYFEGGQRAYFMELDLNNAPQIQQETTVPAETVAATEEISETPATNEVETEPTETEVVEPEPAVEVHKPTNAELNALERQKKIEAAKILKELGINKPHTRKSIIENTHSYSDTSKEEHFNEQRFEQELRLIEIGNSMNVDLSNLRKHLIEKKDGQYFLREDLIPILRRHIEDNKYKNYDNFSYFKDALEACTETDEQGNESINRELLALVESFMEKIDCNGYISKIKTIANLCQYKQYGRTIPDYEALNTYLIECTQNELSHFAVEPLMYASKDPVTGKFNKDVYQQLKEIEQENISFYDYSSIIKLIKKGNFPFNIFKENFCYSMMSDLKYKEKISVPERSLGNSQNEETLAKLIYACSKATIYSNDKYILDKQLYKRMINCMKKDSPEYLGSFEDVCEIAFACFGKGENSWDDKETFQEKIFEYAKELKALNCPSSDIAKIIEACRDSEGFFNKDIFGTVKGQLEKGKPINADIINITKAKGRWSDKEVHDPYALVNISDRYNDSLNGLLKYFKAKDYNFSTSTFNQFIDEDYSLLAKYDFISSYYFDNLTSNGIYDHQFAELLRKLDTAENPAFKDGTNDDKVTQHTTLTRKEIIRNIITISCNKNYKQDYHVYNRTAEKFIDYCLKQGLSLEEINNKLHNATKKNKTETYTLSEQYVDNFIQLHSNGYSTDDAHRIAFSKDEETRKLIKEFLDAGVKDADINIITRNNEIDQIAKEYAYTAAKDGLSSSLKYCIDENDQFSPEIYEKCKALLELGFDSKEIVRLMDACNINTTDFTTKISDNAYNAIADLKGKGFNTEQIEDIIKSSKRVNERTDYEDFIPEKYNRVNELLKYKYDQSAVSYILNICKSKGMDDEEKYQEILEDTKDYLVLKDIAHDGKYIVEKLLGNKNSIIKTKETYGADITRYALGMKIDGYTQFCANVANMTNKVSEEFTNKLKEKLELLPSPELKVKKLRVISGLHGKIEEKALLPLVNSIKSPEMTESQIEIATKIFALDTSDTEKVVSYINSSNLPDASKEIVRNAAQRGSLNQNALSIVYSAQIEEFLEKMDAPSKNKDIIRKYLQQANLQKHIVRPKTIDAQLKNMDELANKTLMNPNIPLEKKLQYIEEYKTKKADMIANSEKYIKPYINAKPLEGLKRVVEAYINIPNDDTKFSNSIYESMYNKFNIETTSALLSDIHYDSKYFDKILSAGTEFGANFKKLIELKKLNPHKKLTESRMVLPEPETTEYELYKNLGLIDQIKANQRTKQAFIENNINFDKWNSFDSDLVGETFSVETDKETALNNAKFNFLNEMNGELFAQISEEETDKLKEHLSKFCGVTFFNNKIYKGQNEIEASYVETLINTILKYKEENPYWNGTDSNSNVDRSPIEGFIDHMNSIKTKLEELKNARNVEDLRLRLTDENDIGRNIFFGNHVGCCNSVESSYAGYSAPLHLLNAYNRGIEIVDSRGNSYGNSLCFFAKVDGKLTFIIDSFEANGKLGSDPIVTENIIKFAQQVCNEMGVPNAQIMFGPNYNNISTSMLEISENHTIKPIGVSNGRTYCDSVGGKVTVGDEISGRKMFKLK